MEPKQCCIYTVLEDNISRKYLLSLLAKHGIITTNSSIDNQELVKLKALITAAFTAINSEKDNIRALASAISELTLTANDNQENIGTLRRNLLAIEKSISNNTDSISNIATTVDTVSKQYAEAIATMNFNITSLNQKLARYSIERPITRQMSFDQFPDIAPPAKIWRNSKLVCLYMHLNSQVDFTCNVTVYFLQPVSISTGIFLQERVLIDKRIEIKHFSNSYFLTNDNKADVEIEMGRTLKVAFNNIDGGGYAPYVNDPHSCLIQYILE